MSSNPKDISKSLGETRQSQQSANNNGSNPKDISKSLGETRQSQQSQQSANNNGDHVEVGTVYEELLEGKNLLNGFSKDMPAVDEDQQEDDVHANRTDHDEGLWEDIPTLMASPPPSPNATDNPLKVTSKKTRQATRLRRLTTRSLNHPRLLVSVNPATGRGSGPHKEKFHSYLGVVAREKIPIVHATWNDVQDDLKKLVWEDILRKLDIPEGENAKKKVMSTVASKWRQFKSHLTSKFVFADNEGQASSEPTVKHGIDLATWAEFAKSRQTPNWQYANGRKRFRNTMIAPTPYLEGGYELPDKKLVDEKTKRREQLAEFIENPSSSIDPPSPVSRQEKWKMARTNRYGKMSSTVAKEIADKIDSLEQEATQGSFVPHGPSRGSSTSSPSITQAQLADIIIGITDQREDAWQREFEAQHTCQIEMMKKELQASIKIEVSQIASHQSVPIESALIQVLGARVSTKGSCAEPQAQGLAKDPSDVGVELMGFTSRGLAPVYGFLEPQAIHCAKDKRTKCEQYIANWVKESHREVYLGPYLNQAHWKLLVLCSRDNIVLWFCSLRKKPDVHIKAAINSFVASNFPASLLRIGSREYKSKHEGDLVAKCYFAKHKLVWEVLEGELKNKMEIQWSDIMALKANCLDTGPSLLTVVLARQPLLFKETNPQPRKHTIWQPTSDFTEGEACKHRQHFLEFPQGLLAKHFEKLIQCDTHLNFLSQQPEIILDSPHFGTRPAAFENLDNPEDPDLHLVNCKGSTTSCLQDIGSPHSSLSPSFKIEHNDLLGIASNNLPCEAPFPSSGTGPRNWDQIKLPRLRPSMAVSDFIGHIEHCLFEQITSGNPSFCGGRLEFQEMLEEIAQHLLNDNKVITTSDEKSLMTRVNSLCCLLQKDPAALQSSHDKESADEGPADGKSIQLSHDLESMQNNKIKIWVLPLKL
ncbi:hypothetical protein HKD37_05G013445 [Glycine soja]